ncbi:transporter substrate-binding domain-containing protein [Shewanella surugensis]|uniref:Transporter substrate-binding domain-containing protein n=1 Tax=Shewanella surugensis TaxID=212020 RepID=A0ABT0LC38_9GAMM|nr:transporter substrate-binding domain-containing protein [Shewanella surugensis]MCL1124761.1 transporter substrate-binding domain-containing protein [Shewanella surugensis]
MKIIAYFMIVLAFNSVIISAHGENAFAHEGLILGMDAHAYPVQFINNHGQPEGLLVDIWTQWAYEANIPIRFKAVADDELEQQLMTQHIDLHIGASRDLNVDNIAFSAALSSVNHYLYLHQALSVPEKINELSMFKIGVIKGSLTAKLLATGFPTLNLRYYPDRHALVEAAANTEVYVIAAAEGFLRSHQVERQVKKGFLHYNRLFLHQSVFHPLVLKSNVALITRLSQLNVNTANIAKLTQKWLGKGQGASSLTLGIPHHFAPYASIGVDGLAHGLLIDIWQAWSHESGVTVDFVFDHYGANIKALKAGSLEAILGYPSTEIADTRFKRQQGLYQMKMRFFSYQEPIVDLTVLAGKRVAISTEFLSLDIIRKYLPKMDLVYMDDINAMIEASESHQVAGFIAPSALTQHYLLLAQKWQTFYQHSSLAFNANIELITLADQQYNELDVNLRQGFELLSTEELINIERKWILDPQDHTVSQTQKQLIFTEKEQAYLAQLGVLKVGYLADWKPMEFTGETGVFSGINSDIFNRIAAALGISIEPVAFHHWNELLTALYQGEVDMAGSIANIRERQNELLFSQSYWPSSWGLVTRLSEVNFFHLDDLAGLRLAVVEGYHLVPKLMREQPSLQLVLVPDIQAGLNAVTRGKADVFIDKLVNLGMTLKHTRSNILKMSILVDFSEQRSHIGIHPQHALLPPLIDKVLVTLDAPTQQAIQQKWVKHTLPSKGVHKKIWVDIVVVSVLFLLSVWGLIWLIRNSMQKKGRSRL